MPFPRNVSTPLFLQRTPRAAARVDRPQLALGDAGHGSAPDTQNPLLYGLGVTLAIHSDVFTRTLRVYVEARDPDTDDLLREEVTSQLVRDPTVLRRYLLRGTLGRAPFGLTTFVEDDFDGQTRRVEVIVVARNAAIETEQRYEFYVCGGVLLARCPSSAECDFPFLKPISKAGVRIFENLNDIASTPVSFFFAQLDALMARVPDLTTILPNYSVTGTVGVEFGNDGRCGTPNEGVQPHCAGLYCCCSIRTDLIEIEITDITTPALDPVSAGDPVNFADVLDVHVTIPTGGSSTCIGFDSLRVGLPGLDSTGGVWNLFDPVQSGGFLPTATLNGAPVTPVFTQGGTPGGDGSGNAGELDFTGIPIACGDEIELHFRVMAALLTGTNGATAVLGALTFSDGGPCNPQSTLVLPALSILEEV